MNANGFHAIQIFSKGIQAIGRCVQMFKVSIEGGGLFFSAKDYGATNGMQGILFNLPCNIGNVKFYHNYTGPGETFQKKIAPSSSPCKMYTYNPGVL